MRQLIMSDLWVQSFMWLTVDGVCCDKVQCKGLKSEQGWMSELCVTNFRHVRALF